MTLFLLGKDFAGLKVVDYYPALKFINLTQEDIMGKYSEFSEKCPLPYQIAAKMGGFFHEKYERYLPVELLYENNAI
jgi:hypothetical protein